MEDWCNDTDRVTETYSEETCQSDILSTTNPTRTGLSFNPALRGEWPETKCPSNGTAGVSALGYLRSRKVLYEDGVRNVPLSLILCHLLL